MKIDINEFFDWVASHRDHEVIGLPGRCFDSPLARWLSEQVGHVIGVDGRHYGRALVDAQRWQVLPYWAYVFTMLCEGLFGRALTASEVVDVLIQVEAMVPVGQRVSA